MDKELKIKILGEDKASLSIGKVADQVENLGKAVNNKNLREGIQSISTQLQNTKQQLIGLFVGIPAITSFVSGFTKLAETAATVNARLKLAAESSQDFAQSQADAQRIALSAGQAYEAIAGLYSKLRVNAGLAAEDAAKLTEVIAQATQLDGGGAGAEAAVFQLQQGLAAGALRGEELNSVLEQTPSLAKAIADGLGVNIGQLRKIAEQGGLTADVVKDALFKMQSQIESDFSKLPVTTSRAFQNIRTQAILVLGKIDDTLGITKTFSTILQTIADNMQDVIALTSGGVVALVGLLATAGTKTSVFAVSLAAVGATLKTILTPMGAVVLTLSTLTTLLIANIDRTVEFGGKTATVGQIINAAWRAIGDAISNALSVITRAIRINSAELSGMFSFVSSTAGRLFSRLLDLVNSVVSGIVTGFRVIGTTVGATAASMVQQFRLAVDSIRSLFSALTRDINEAFTGQDFALDKTTSAITDGLKQATEEAGNLKKEIVDTIDQEAEFLKNGGVLSSITKSIAAQLEETKAISDEFKKRSQQANASPVGVGGSAAARNAALKAEQDLAKARADLENTLFQQVKRFADDQTQRDIQSTRELFQLKAITADEYYRRLNELQTQLTQREIAELERQKAAMQAIVNNPNTSAPDRLKALADIAELSTSAAIVERELQQTRSGLVNEIAALEANRLKTQQDFLVALEREAFLSGLSNEERGKAIALIEAQKAGVTDLSKVIELQEKIQANENVKRQQDELKRQQDQIFESVTRGVQTAFADGLFRVLKGEGGINEILSGIGDAFLRAISNAIAGDLTDVFFRAFRPSGGASPVPGGGFLSGLRRLLPFAEGGYTGQGGKYDPAGVVHRGEYVFSASAVNKLGINALNNLHMLAKGVSIMPRPGLGFAEGGFVSGIGQTTAKQPSTNITLQVNPDSLNFTMRDWLEGELARIAVGVR